jgi:predicted ester cyclase
MSTEANKIVVRHVFEEIFNRGNLAAADELIHPDLVEHANIPLCATGPETIRQVANFCRSILPDVHFAIEEMVAEGDKVFARTTLTGTNKGEFQGRPPTNKPVLSAQYHIARLVDGKMVEHWEIRDDLTFMQQLGVIPARR